MSRDHPILGFMQGPGRQPRGGGTPISLELYKPVRLRFDLQIEDHMLRKGTRGVLVDGYDGSRFGVEFAEPIKDVLVLPTEALEPLQN